MKNKLLTLSIAAALSSFWGHNALAAGNSMDVFQDASSGSVTATQEATADDPAVQTSTSSINILQKNVDADTSITIKQTGATAANAEVKQFHGVNSHVTINQMGGEANAGNTARVIQGQEDTEGTNAGNTLSITTQSGSGNKILGYAESDSDANDEQSYATQLNSSNNATLTQNGTSNTMGLQQDGATNILNMNQDTTSANSRMNVRQSGDGNKVTANQIGTDNSTINIDINGTDNNLGDDTYKVEQASNDSTITVKITGDNNTANLSQGVSADNSLITLTQDGNSNSATIVQTDLENNATLTQTNDNNTASLTQNGIGDRMTVTQNGGSTATLLQN